MCLICVSMTGAIYEVLVFCNDSETPHCLDLRYLEYQSNFNLYYSSLLRCKL